MRDSKLFFVGIDYSKENYVYIVAENMQQALTIAENIMPEASLCEGTFSGASHEGNCFFSLGWIFYRPIFEVQS